MGRTQTFDTTAVVGLARDVFWRLGYDATSLGDLERATGIGRSSLYHAFGSKRGLFDAAVENYLDEIVRPRLAVLAGRGARAAGADAPDGNKRQDGIGEPEGSDGPEGRGTDVGAAAARTALGAYFAEMSAAVAALGHDDGRAGCLLLISTAGHAGHDAMVRAAVDAYRAELSSAFADAVRRALPGAGEDAVERHARLFTALVVAALTLARVNREEAVATLRLGEDASGSLYPAS